MAVRFGERRSRPVVTARSEDSAGVDHFALDGGTTMEEHASLAFASALLSSGWTGLSDPASRAELIATAAALASDWCADRERRK